MVWRCTGPERVAIQNSQFIIQNYMETKEKDEIREALRQYVERYPSQNKAAASLKGISAGTLSTILNGKYENISEEMWRNIAAQVSFATPSDGWKIVETSAFVEINVALKDAKEECNTTWVVGEAGCGKTTTAKLFAGEHKEVFYVSCSEDMKKSDFVREVATRIGIHSAGYNIRQLWNVILANLHQMDAPVIIFDEADKLTEAVFHYFISLYNNLEDHCGIVFLSTDYIKRRINNGLRYEKAGYKEFYSRIGRKYFELEPTDATDVYAICTANGLTDRRKIDKVVKEASECEYDLRRVKKSVRREKKGL